MSDPRRPAPTWFPNLNKVRDGLFAASGHFLVPLTVTTISWRLETLQLRYGHSTGFRAPGECQTRTSLHPLGSGNGRKVQHRHVEHDGSKGGGSAFGAGPGGSGSRSHPWQKTEPVGVKTDGLAKSEAYGLWQYDMTSRRCRQIARVEIQTHALHIYTHNTI